MTRPFRFGAQLAWPAAPEPDGWAVTARRVEAMGYAVLTMPDHLGDQLAPVTALAWAAAATTSLRVGSLVFGNDYRHPVVVARETATLDLLSGGRAELGLGAGWLRSDYEASGLPFDPPARRVERLGEAVGVVKALLRGEKVTWAGDHYRLDGLPGTPRPVQRPHPPLLIGGGGRRVLELAGREADIVSVNYHLGSAEMTPGLGAEGTVARTRSRLRWVQEAAAGRPEQPELSVTVYATIVTDDRSAAATGLGAMVGLAADDVLASPHFAIGTVAQITADLCRRRDELGFTYVIFGGNGWEAVAPVVEHLAGR